MIEELLRDSFARHETMAPPPDPVRARIATLVRRRRRRAAATRTAAVLVLVALLGVGVLVDPLGVLRGGRLSAAGDALPNRITRPVTVLLVGVDRRAGSPEPVRADTIMLAHVPAGGGRAYLISIPRDTGPEPLADSYARHGRAWLVERVTALTGVALDVTVEVEFAGLIAVTDAVGGVDLCVDVVVVSEHLGFDRHGRYLSPRDGGQPVRYDPGCRHFTGVQALDYLRQRVSLPDGDLGRQRHNRQYLEALVDKLAGADFGRLNAVLRAADGAVRIDAGAYTLAQLALAGRGLSAADVTSIGPPVFDWAATPQVAGLWAALRAGTLDAWAAANPDWVS